MRASGRITASIANRSSRRDPPKQPTYSRLTCSAANALEYWEPRKFQGERENRTDKCGWQSQDVNKRLKLLVGTRPVLPTADRTISRKTNCPRTFLLSEAFRVRLACVSISGIVPTLPGYAVQPSRQLSGPHRSTFSSRQTCGPVRSDPGGPVHL